jgi:predicted PurR-regulated permease PerM
MRLGRCACIFVVSAYTFLVDGPRGNAWLEAHAPIKPLHFRRLASAFTETGRGLLIGMGLMGLAQAVIATIAYFALGVPRALVLGLLTLFASLIPSIGTALIWAPIAAGLALTNRTGPAVVLTVIGAMVIGSVDNFMRPIFARFGALKMPSYVLLISIFGGLAVFGGWGLILRPLIVRLTLEALAISRDDNDEDKGKPLPSDVQPPNSALL